MRLRNLALIEGGGLSYVTMPCPSCFLRHRVAIRDVREDEELAERTKAQTGYLPSPQVKVEHLLDIRQQQINEQYGDGSHIFYPAHGPGLWADSEGTGIGQTLRQPLRAPEAEERLRTEEGGDGVWSRPHF